PAASGGSRPQALRPVRHRAPRLHGRPDRTPPHDRRLVEHDLGEPDGGRVGRRGRAWPDRPRDPVGWLLPDRRRPGARRGPDGHPRVRAVAPVATPAPVGGQAPPASREAEAWDSPAATSLGARGARRPRRWQGQGARVVSTPWWMAAPSWARETIRQQGLRYLDSRRRRKRLAR